MVYIYPKIGYWVVCIFAVIVVYINHFFDPSRAEIFYSLVYLIIDKYFELLIVISFLNSDNSYFLGDLLKLCNSCIDLLFI